MAYVASGLQKRRGEDGAVPDSNGNVSGGSGSPDGGAAPKQDSVAKSPIRAQVAANKGYSQEAAINRVYKPFEQEVNTAKAGYDDQKQQYLADENKKTQNFAIGDDEIKKQVGAGQITGDLSRVLGGYNDTFNPGDFNVQQKPIDAAKELAGRSATTSLMRGGTGNYGRGMASLDNALLRASGGIGQLGQAIGAGTNQLRSYGQSLQSQAPQEAAAARQQVMADTQGRTQKALGDEVKSMESLAGDRYGQYANQEKQERQGVVGSVQQQIADAVKSLQSDPYGSVADPEIRALQALQADSYVNQFQDQNSLGALNPEEWSKYAALQGYMGGQSTPVAGLGDQSFAVDQGRAGNDINAILQQFQQRIAGPKAEEEARRQAQRDKLVAAERARKLDPRYATPTQQIANYATEGMGGYLPGTTPALDLPPSVMFGLPGATNAFIQQRNVAPAAPAAPARQLSAFEKAMGNNQVNRHKTKKGLF